MLYQEREVKLSKFYNKQKHIKKKLLQKLFELEFLAIYNEYKDAKQVTQERMYLETMEKVLNIDKVIIDESGSGVVPYLPLPELKKEAIINERR